MKIAMIPARYLASRFPAKLMKDLHGKPVIIRTYEAVVNTQLFDKVFVVTDSDLIYQAIKDIGGEAIMSIGKHESGSDRIAEAALQIKCDIIVNVQGDEPFTEKQSLERLLEVFKNDKNHQIDLASLMVPITNEKEIGNPNAVKVIVDQENFALYFSRSPIPYQREKNSKTTYYKHKGVYAFRKQALLDFAQLPMSPLEAAEKIECLRYLEYNRKIKMVVSDVEGVEIDTVEDLEKARKIWK